jgi:hypothetical protein
MVRVASLRAKSLNLFFEKDSNPQSYVHNPEGIAAEALDLDSSLITWSQAVPEEWKFETQGSTTSQDPPEKSHVFDGPVHAYSTLGHACIWNRYRAFRLIVNSIHIRSLSNLHQNASHSSLDDAQKDLCQKNIWASTNDMCRSVPFFFNSPDATGGGAGSKSIRVGKHVIRTDCEIIPKVAGLLAWPLAVAVSTDGVPDPQREWLKSRLRTVAKALGDAILESVADQGEFKF